MKKTLSRIRFFIALALVLSLADKTLCSAINETSPLSKTVIIKGENKDLSSLNSVLAGNNYAAIIKYAKNAEASGNYNQAFSCYEALIKKFPNQINIMEEYSSFAVRNKYYLKAIELNNKLYILTGNKKYKAENTRLGFLQAGKDKKSAKSPQVVFIKHPHDIKTLERMINLSYKHAKFNKTAGYCNTYSLSGNNSKIKAACGKSYFYTGNNKKASEFLESYIESNPYDKIVLQALGDISLSLKDYKKASLYFSRLASVKNDKDLKLKLGNVYMAAHEFDKASKVYSELLLSDPNNKNLLNSLLNSYLAGNKTKESIKTAKKLLELDKDNENLKKTLANSYMAGGDFKNANKILAEISSKKPDDTAFLKSLLDSDLALGAYNEAEAVANRLLKLNPSDRKVKRKLADIYLAQSNYEMAQKTYNELLKYDPESFELITGLADSCSAQKKYSDAAVYLAKAIALKQKILSKEEHKTLLKRLGNLYMAASDFNNAENTFSELAEKYPDNTEILNSLADSYLANKKFPEAINVLSQLSKDNPADNNIKIKIVRTFFAMNDLSEATPMLEELIKVLPENTELLGYLADSYLVQSNYDKAIETLTQLLKLSPDDKSARNKLGNAYLVACKFEEAKGIFSSLLKEDPENFEIKKTLADCYLALGDYQSAVDLLDPEIKKHPEDIKLIIKFSQALIALEKYEYSRKILEDAYIIYPSNTAIMELLGDTSLYLKDYNKAITYYKSIENYVKNENIVFNLAEAYRFLENYPQAEGLYIQLKESPKYQLRAAIGYGYAKIGENEIYQARDVFSAILKQNPDNYEAKLGLAVALNSTEDYFSALKILDTLPVNDRTNYEKAVAYFKMKMYQNVYKLLADNSLDKAKQLYQLNVNKLKIDFEPTYDFHIQSGDDNHKLTYHRYGFEISDYLKYNIKAKAGFDVTPYRSGGGVAKATAYTYRIGLEGRPFKKFAFDSDIGFKDFSNDNMMLVGKVIADYHASDSLKLTGGFIRSNVEQTLLSATGIKPTEGPFAGKLVGQDADNKFLVAYNLKLPKYMFTYGGYNFGWIKGLNVPRNLYHEGDLGLGKIFYSRPEGELLDLAMGELNSYFATYGDDRYGFGGASLTSLPIGFNNNSPDPSSGNPGVGGYFSPKYILANKFAMHLRGKLNPINTKYYLYGYLGSQTIADQGTDLLWGARTSLVMNDQGRLGLGFTYNVDNYNVATKQDFIVNLIMRL